MSTTNMNALGKNGSNLPIVSTFYWFNDILNEYSMKMDCLPNFVILLQIVSNAVYGTQNKSISSAIDYLLKSVNLNREQAEQAIESLIKFINEHYNHHIGE